MTFFRLSFRERECWLKPRVRQMFPRFLSQHNPFIRHIVRRSRKYLEETKDPETNEPCLKPIAVELLGW